MKLFTVLLAALVLSTGIVRAAVPNIRGTILDITTNEPIIGATVIVEGTTNGTITDAEGNFMLQNVDMGSCTLVASFLGYKSDAEQVEVAQNEVAVVRFTLEVETMEVNEVIIRGYFNQESESAQLHNQQESVVATQSVGAQEMSRKGAGDAQSAVAQVAGVSKQEGVKNVFVRGLGDRYNTTLLNGFPVPSEDPEYKNIALQFFGADIIQNIGVAKVFDAAHNGDVAGAVINVNSKELTDDEHLITISLDGGVNSRVPGANFLKQDGAGNTRRPSAGHYDFANSLDPSKVRFPLNYSVGISGGKSFDLNGSPLSFFVTASHTSDHSFSKQAIRNSTTDGTVYLDQQGEKSTINTDQLVLANVAFRPGDKHEIAYNFMLLHALEQYVGQYHGTSDKFAESPTYQGYMMRQQSNDNLLMTHQLLSEWNLSERFQVHAGAAYNSISGDEPDRRENLFTLLEDGRYMFTGSNRQKRFFSELSESDVNLKADVRFKLDPEAEIDRSNVTLGYRGRIVDDSFSAIEYNIEPYPGGFPSIDGLLLDDLYNGQNYQAGEFTMSQGPANSYKVDKTIHSAYLEATHAFTDKFTANVGMQWDMVDMRVAYNVQHVAPGEKRIDKNYYLPTLNLRYDISEKHSLRLGASQSYILPQPKEISPYRYINIGFASEGNPDIRPSVSYNLDLKWDWYVTASELISLGAFYKLIEKPMGRVDEGNSAGLLTYNNIASKATVAGVEFEMRKNLFTQTADDEHSRKISLGLNASYIYSDLSLDVNNTAPRHTQLEGASPLILNGDLSYDLRTEKRRLLVSLVANYYSARIHTLGTQGYRDIIEEGVVTLSAVGSFKINDLLTIKLKAGNLLDPTYRLTRKFGDEGKKTTLESYKKGMDLSLGVAFSF